MVTDPEAGLNPMPVATDRKKRAEALEAGALDTKGARCRLHRYRQMEALVVNKKYFINHKPIYQPEILFSMLLSCDPALSRK